MSQIQIRLPKGMNEQWFEYCEKLGKRPGTAGRELLCSVLNEPVTVEPMKVKKPRIDQKKKKVDLLLTESEINAANARFKALGYTSRAAWLLGLIRESLTAIPFFNAEQISVLKESNYELKAIGRNLNQIARALNEGQGSVDLEAIHTMAKSIDEHTNRVRTCIDANRQRWEIES